MNKIDLHSHSCYSLDGEFKPDRLVDIALERGIEYYAIADHDDVRAIDSALSYAKGKPITVIPAIEISAIIDDTPLHILGYNIDHHNSIFDKRRKYIDEELIGFKTQAIKKAHEYGFFFEDEKLDHFREDGLICEEHIGEVVLNDPRNNNHPELMEFREGGKLSDNPYFNFYREFFSIGKPLNIIYNFNLDIAETSKLIHEGGGKMFLAHPGHNIKRDEEKLKKIISYGLDGIEVFSSYHDQQTIDFYYKKAKEYNLFMSVGSDFHGKSKPAIAMGSVDYDENELAKTIEMLGLSKK